MRYASLSPLNPPFGRGDFESLSPPFQRGAGGDKKPYLIDSIIAIKERLLNWQNIYDEIMNWDDPASSDFASEAEKMAFEKEGISLWQLVQKELENEYEVVYFSEVKRRVLSGFD